MTCITKKLNLLSRFPLRLLSPKCDAVVIPAMSKVTVHESDKKSGYNTKIPLKLSDVKDGINLLKPELKKFKDEMVTKFRCDGFYERYHQDFEYFEKFDSEADSLEEWTVTADSDHLEGKSSVQLVRSRHNHALFLGNISNDTPKDGITARAGYCNLRSPRNMRSFQRVLPYDWSRYTHLVMRVRGDGRPYLFTIGMDMYFDVNWSDQYNFTLYTRGGPYWQTSKIPFSKFFRSAKGRIQDRQERIQLDRVAYLGLTQGDGNEGPFHLEIDYIGLMYDENNDEKFAYETYHVTPFLVGT